MVNITLRRAQLNDLKLNEIWDVKYVHGHVHTSLTLPDIGNFYTVQIALYSILTAAEKGLNQR